MRFVRVFDIRCSSPWLPIELVLKQLSSAAGRQFLPSIKKFVCRRGRGWRDEAEKLQVLRHRKMTDSAAVNGVALSDIDLKNIDLKSTKTALRSSSISVRIPKLTEINEKISDSDFDRSTTAELVQILFWTHAFYNDRESRRAVQRCLASICKSGKSDVLVPFISDLRQETSKPGIAPNDAFVLAEWCSLLMINLVGTGLWDKYGTDIVLSNADALERCLQPNSRRSIGHSALVVTRRGVRQLVGRNDKLHEKAISDAVHALTTKSSQPTARNAVMLGVLAGVCARIEKAKPVLDKFKNQYFSFYVREIVGSRTPLPAHLAGGLDDFFSVFVTADDLNTQVFPSLEKGLLRAPEVVLDLITPLVHSLPNSYDLSTTLHDRLLKPLLSNVKSTNPVIRNGTVSAFKVLVQGCRDFKILEEVANEILAPLKAGKLASPDHRVLHCEMLASLPNTANSSSELASSLPLVTAKEGNEPALAAETLALLEPTVQLLRTGKTIPKPLVDAYTKGLSDKKLPFRRTWILRTGEVLRHFLREPQVSPNVLQFADLVLPPLMETAVEVVANPFVASQNGLVTAGLVACSLPFASPALTALSKKFSTRQHSLVVHPKPSFLLSPRVYSKFSLDDDLRWFYRALATVVSMIPPDNSEAISSAWAEAFLFIVCSRSVSPMVRREACEALTGLYVENPTLVSKIVVGGIWHWLNSLESGDKESAAVLAKSEADNLHLALNSICLSGTGQEHAYRIPKEQRQEHLEIQMCSLLVLARPDLVPRVRWIDLCLRVGVDPGDLVRKHEDKLLQEVVTSTSDQKVCRRTIEGFVANP